MGHVTAYKDFFLPETHQTLNVGTKTCLLVYWAKPDQLWTVPANHKTTILKSRHKHANAVKIYVTFSQALSLPLFTSVVPPLLCKHKV